jgi:DNA-binding MarR family transcriptional regulator
MNCAYHRWTVQGKDILRMTNRIADAEPKEPLRLGRFLPYRLSILAESVSRAFARQYGERFGISVPEWRVMAVLGESGPQTTKEVIARTRMDRVSVSRAAIRLDDKKLIIRAPVPGDMRAHRLRLSPRGTTTYREIVPLAFSLQAELMAGLSQGERDALESAIDKLLERADRLGCALLLPKRTRSGP